MPVVFTYGTSAPDLQPVGRRQHDLTRDTDVASSAGCCNGSIRGANHTTLELSLLRGLPPSASRDQIARHADRMPQRPSPLSCNPVNRDNRQLLRLRLLRSIFGPFKDPVTIGPVAHSSFINVAELLDGIIGSLKGATDHPGMQSGGKDRSPVSAGLAMNQH